MVTLIKYVDFFISKYTELIHWVIFIKKVRTKRRPIFIF